ncbi:MAG TPA: DUF262 domain-containing protein [Noviherbaspirillum sp.]|uniref:DUF262 domain-containing protein n=1 Tax=Noviherbaspirillum sp. TaxID=1926288 RepID=UPI002B48E8A8|nr:DUF262 domain-containing protein [Noviherbaspirillum sp.]HJV84715.1 DUF262 domain-containing protein [Noviherbaspirillum sp.]
MNAIVEFGIGKQVTFKGLFEVHAFVEVPIIQRDYAQGRASETEVREEFLSALYAALMKSEGDSSLPLDLDFIYGSAPPGGRMAFSPLDGQQRLTTLFLLHWYLAWNDGAADDFNAFIRDGKRSRFTYTVRPSSREFFDALVCWTPPEGAAQAGVLSRVIVDQPWFFRAWRLDPTIQSALAMLDAIHRRFSGSSGCYARLVHPTQPYITFQLLDLRSFGLSDDLYIKMNARGKPLTAFETFKARLENHIGNLFPRKDHTLHGKPVTLKEYFSHKIDTVWGDLFWHYRNNETMLFDDRIMHLVRTLATVTRDPDAGTSRALLTQLRSPFSSFSFLRYRDEGCLDTALLETLVATLDVWSGGKDGIRPILAGFPYYDERKAFLDVVSDSTKLTYAELVQFHAYTTYLRRYQHQLQPDSLADWMRVVVNLSSNTSYDDVDDFRRSVKAVNNLIEHAQDILAYLRQPSVDSAGFFEQQMREEQLKAHLLARSDDWRTRILKAEAHPYFSGQIEFLFQFSGVLERWKMHQAADWSDGEDKTLQSKFDDYFSKASRVFSGGPSALGDKRWERALLTIGDYLLAAGRNRHFLQMYGRDTSWKRFLRGNIEGSGEAERKRRYVKELLDMVDTDVNLSASLERIIADAPATNDWREPFIRCPAVLEYCQFHMIRYQSPDRIYLLRKQRMNGDHVELYSYHLYRTVLQDMAAKGELVPFTAPFYRSVNTDTEEPHIAMECPSDGTKIMLTVFNSGKKFEMKLSFGGQPAPVGLKDRLTGVSPTTEKGNGGLSFNVQRDSVRTAIKTIVLAVQGS